jgi:SAM-dependent methyltransferase
LREFYNGLASRKAHFRKRNAYYYQEILRYLRFLIPSGQSVLEVGCGDGFVLENLHPRRGLGIDLSEVMVKAAQARSKAGDSTIEYRVGDADSLALEETFDSVLWSDLLGDLPDIQNALEHVRSACDSNTRLVFHYHNIFWEPIVKLAQTLGLKTPQLNHNWMTRHDIENLLNLADFEMVSFERKILIPIRIPLLSTLCNRWIATLPGFRNFCLVNIIVARKKVRPQSSGYSVSIIVPCRNEKGTIRAAVERLPVFGTSQEIIFVDGHSTDGTWEEIERVKAEFPHREIHSYRQAGKGKGDAVRLGFDKASKDILLILDSDLAVPPEDMPKFYQALAMHKAEFVNGSRLVYPMEAQAMRFLNILGNKFFSMALSWLLNQPLKDTLCGTKALFKKDYERIHAGRAYFGNFDPFGDFDLLFGAVRQKLKILEIPVRYRERVYGTTNISRFRHGFLLMKMVVFGFIKLKW